MELYKIQTQWPVEGCCESGIGGRSENQDSYGYQDTPFGLLVAVCDGMGGGPAGKTASTIAVNEIIAGVMEADPGEAAEQVLLDAIRRANRAILQKTADNPKLQGMGTTCAVTLISAESALVAHVGDSRVYQLRRRRKVFRTFDHSVVFEMVKNKVITEEQARLSDQSNVITRALGMKEDVEIDLAERPYAKGDRFMLTSDGIHGTMAEPELIRRATRRGPLEATVDDLAHHVDEQGQAHGGGHDNLTVVVVETKTKSKRKETMKYKTTLILSVIAAMLAATLLLLNGCQNKDIDVETFSIADEQVWPSTDTVGIRGTYDFFMEAEGMKINIGMDSTLSDANSHAVALSGKDYAVTVRHLQPNTTYYYGYSVDLGLKRDFLTETRHFTTLALPPVQEYAVSVAANPTDGGAVTGGGTYTEGQTCAVSATANEGYTFINWTENDSVVSADSLYRFTVNADRALVAQFEMQIPEPEEYTITVSANPTNGGAVSGGGTYQEGQQCTVTATANTGYTFINWTENGEQVSANANYTFTVNSNRTLVANFTAASYIIAASVEPENSGTITGAGGYESGQSCTLRATANTGYTFANWTENGNVVSTNAAYTFNVTASRNLVAHFNVKSYTISVSASPSNGGTASGGGTYQHGQSCTVHAVANSGFTFTSWTENGNVVSTNANYTFTVSGNRNLVAKFSAQPQSYTISVSANPTNGGTVSGGGTYQQGQSCTVHATANSGYTFTNWTENGNVVSTNANYTFTVTGNRTLVAHFQQQAPHEYTINVAANPTNGGTVTGGGTYQQGQQCTVTATANRSSAFSYDFENSSLEGLILIDGGNPTGYGWQLASVKMGTGYGHNASVDCILSESYDNNYGVVYPDNYVIFPQSDIGSGSTFSFWACAQSNVYAAEHFGVAVSTTGTNASDFTMLQEWTMTAKQAPATKANIRGQRTQGNWHQYTVDLSGYAGQIVYIAIRHFHCSDQFYLDVDDVELIASNGFSFVNWTENGNVVSTNANYTFTVTGDRNLVANFQQQAPQSYNISVSANPTSGGTVTGGGTYLQGQSCTVSATANSGYTFTNWTENGSVVSTNANYTFTVTGNRTLVANFTAQTPQNYTITVSANPTSGGTVTGGGTYQEGQSCTVHATANSGYTFTNWTENGNVVSTNANYTFTVTGNRTLVANFTAQTPQNYTITVSANPTSGGTASGGGTYQEGQQCTVTASANTGFDFANWTENGNVVSSNANYTFTVNSNRTLVANFTAQTQPWTLLSTFEAAEGGQYGVVSDGVNIYTSNWGYSGAIHNFYKYDMQGNVIVGFEIDGSGTCRGMTYDGQYFYGVDNSSTVYCLDLANHNLVSTFNSAYGAMRGITYDPDRDGFWVIGNWSGNLTLIDRTGAVQLVGPAPSSVSDLAYYKDDNDVEHVYCFNNADNGVYDYNITTNTLGGAVFNFSNTPGYSSGSSGGCHVGQYGDSVAFFGDIQQSPNLIGIYFLRQAR